MDLDSLTELDDDTLFKFEMNQPRSYDLPYNSIMAVSVEMNLDQTYIIRNGYTILDLLSDIGGIQSILRDLFNVILAFLNYNHMVTFMASKLFKIKKKQSEEVKNSSYFERSSFFTPSKISNLKEYMMDLLPT